MSTLRVVPALLAGLALTACSAAVPGRSDGPVDDVAAGRSVTASAASTASSTASGSSAPTGSTPAPTAGAPAPTAGAPGRGTAAPGPGNGGGSAPTSRRTVTMTPTATPTATGTLSPSVPSFTPTRPQEPSSSVRVIGARAYCTSHQDPNGYANLAWSSVGGTKVYILSGRASLNSTDARASGGRGPYPYNGSARVPFDCSGAYDYYRIDVYGIQSQGGLNLPLAYGTP